MELAIFRVLTSPAGQEVLAAAQALAPREADFLRHFTTLSRKYPPNLARAALEIAILRRVANDKFPNAERMYFTRAALEQSSGYKVSTYRSERFNGFQRVFDLGCSIGGDSISLAEHASVVGIDRDPLRLAMARANLEMHNLNHQVAWIQADLTAPLPFRLARKPTTALFFDPARRTRGRRVYSVRQYRPPLTVIDDWLPSNPALGVKISPGVKLDELRAYDAEIEFISLRGQLKESVLWFGSLKTCRHRATVLPGPHTFIAPPGLETFKGSSDKQTGRHKRVLPISEPGAYLYEPDPAIIRAGLVQALGVQLEASQLDPDIAYLTSDRRVATPFARSWQVESWLPFSLKRLRVALHERNIGRVVVKKRGSPLQPDDLIHKLRLKKDRDAERVVFLTHLSDRPIALICLPNQ